MNTGSVLAQFTITLSKAVTEPVSVEWFTSDGTAKAGVDYAANKGIALFAPGETEKNVDILIYGRAVGTEDRSFFVEMLPPTNAILGAAIGECIIHVDTTGSEPVTEIIVPTGPRGLTGKSAYQSWLDTGHSGSEADFLEWLKPSPEEIAEEVAPLLDVGDTVLTAEGTEALSKPDTTTVKAVTRRVAYSAAAKIATVTLSDGDNTLSESNLTGDAVSFGGAGFVPRILRNGVFSNPKWKLNQNGSITVLEAVAGDVLYAVQYDFVSDYNSREAILSVADRSYYTKHKSFEKGSNAIRSAADALLWENAPAGQGPYFVWSGALPKSVPAGSTPASTGGVSPNAWIDVGAASTSSDLSAVDGFGKIGGVTYAGLRAYFGMAKTIQCVGRTNIFDGAYGIFYRDDSDKTSSDDDGVVIVDALNRRWKRVVTDDVYPEWWGAVADNSSDCSPAFQAAIDFCSGKNRPSVKTGFKLRARGGRYVLMTGLVYTWRYDSGIVDDGDMRRFSMEGDGAGNTYLIYKGPNTTPALSIKGGPNNGIYLRTELKDFRLWRSLDLPRYQGVGISIVAGAVFTLTNVDVGIFNTGVDARDTLYATYRNCDFSGNNQGFYLGITSRSEPNSILFDRCMFGGCKIRGALINNGANVEFRGCTFEGIGTDGTGEAILYRGGQHEGGLGLYLSSCYFENNFVQYDVNISNGTSYAGTHIIEGCSFNRPNLSRAPANGSINLYSNTAEMRVSIIGCAFKGFNDYTPSASRPAFTVQSNTVTVTEIGNYYQNAVERPVTNSIPVIGNGLGSVACIASVSLAGVLNTGWNVQSVSKTGTGAYTITLKKPIFGAGVGVANVAGGVGAATVIAVGSTTVQVVTHNEVFNQTDKSFNLIVMGQI